MGQTKNQRKNEAIARLCEQVGGKKSMGAKQLRAINRRVDKRKGTKRD